MTDRAATIFLEFVEVITDHVDSDHNSFRGTVSAMYRYQIVPLCTLSLILVLPSPAHAYLDPGTGSIILQGAIAAIATTGFVAKLYWQRLKSFLRGEGFNSPELTEDSTSESGDQDQDRP